jgi:hypothetical protein
MVKIDRAACVKASTVNILHRSAVESLFAELFQGLGAVRQHFSFWRDVALATDARA